MAIIRCNNGHYYDDQKHRVCPRCLMPSTSFVTQKQRTHDAALAQQTLPSEKSQDQHEVSPVSTGASFVDEQKTIGIFQTNEGINPVVGWLVCIDGKARGQDVRLHAGRNFLRVASAEPPSSDDERLNREKHGSIVFDPQTNLFSFVPGSCEDVMVNAEKQQSTMMLSGDETIVVGGSTFVFIPFCREGRTW